MQIGLIVRNVNTVFQKQEIACDTKHCPWHFKLSFWHRNVNYIYKKRDKNEQ